MDTGTALPRFAAEEQSRLGSLVRRAMEYLDRDRAEAWRCLRDAHSILGEQSVADPLHGPAARTPIQPGGLATWQIRRSLDYIEEHLSSGLAIEDIATHISLSRGHFSRAFKRSLGSSPQTYIAVRRIERAKLTMIATSGRLADVALVCGFADQSHLTKQFRRIVGMSPGRWRRSSSFGPSGRPRATSRL